MTQIEDSRNLIEVLSDMGFLAYLYSECTGSFYHETNKLPDVVRSFFGDSKEHHVAWGKPPGALWLSRGISVDGEVSTQWREFATGANLSRYGNCVYEPIVAPHAVVLEMRESDVVNMPLLQDPTASPLPSGFTYMDLITNMIETGETFSPPFAAMMDMGVHMVRVAASTNYVESEGRYSIGFFNTWDVDSIAVLDGSVITDWAKRPAS